MGFRGLQAFVKIDKEKSIGKASVKATLHGIWSLEDVRHSCHVRQICISEEYASALNSLRPCEFVAILLEHEFMIGVFHHQQRIQLSPAIATTVSLYR